MYQEMWCSMKTFFVCTARKGSSKENPSPTFALDFCYVEEDIMSSNDGQQDQIIISNQAREEQFIEINYDVITEVEEPRNKGERETMTNIDMGAKEHTITQKT